MTIPEQAVHAMPERIFLGCADTDNEHQVWTDEGEGGTEYVRADLAAPHLAAVRVKKLEWSEPYKNVLKAETVNGRWAIQFTAGKWDWWSPQYDDDSFAPKQFDTLEDAKAAAQADYEARILSALEPSAGRAAVLEEAAKIAFDISENGEYHGEASVDSASSIYQQGAYEVYEAIRALASHPVADKPDEAGAQGEGWLPIESAPKDGTHILVYCSRMKEVGEARWHSESFGGHGPTWVIAGFNQAWASEPTHWRPLPTPPSGEAA